MKQSNPKPEVTLDIDALSYGPYGIGRLDGKAVMIPHTAPGDRVIAQITEAKDRYSTGELSAVLAPSPLRQKPACDYVPQCGGCSWQHLRYQAQLNAKQQSVADALRRIGKLANCQILPIIPSSKEYRYRRRIRLQCDRRKRLGFFRSSSHDLIEIERCLIADDRLNNMLELLRHWVDELRTEIDYVEIVCGDAAAQLCIVIAAPSPFAIIDEDPCARLVNENSAIQGLIAHGRGWRRVWGQPWITVQLTSELDLTVDADVFTQVNPAGNQQILAALLRGAAFAKNDRVLELYCGAGNFTLAIAQQVNSIVAVEGYRPALANAKLNAQKLGLDNISWLVESVPAAVAQLKKRRDKFSSIVLDPPRAGAKGLEADLAALGANKIFYVSCNPATLARDVAGLSQLGYRLTTAQPIDLFPHTFHVETLATITRD